eukprot:TRINITY_DN17634_c0_g1_i1.p1 TRINITY_DN17634_c0_g1~~TRINITY_DN17634_c0_g1_i1.p1  ORF type:complete len:409 (-),score=46.69 TRINITY_DN17634_c0_g1_i1:75-1301(-)
MRTLTENGIEAIYGNVTNQQDIQLQVVHIKQTNIGDYYRLCLSDGNYFAPVLLDKSISYMIEEQSVALNSIISLLKYEKIKIKQDCDQVVHLRNLEVVSTQDGKIGSPSSYFTHIKLKKRELLRELSERNIKRRQISNLKNHAITPVKDLNQSTRIWCILACVTTKTPIREFHRTDSSGKFFTVDLVDESGSVIVLSCFGELVEHYYSVFEENKFYYISGGGIKLSKHHKEKNPYELYLTNETAVKLCDDKVTVRPTTVMSPKSYQFQKLSSIEHHINNYQLDVLFVILRELKYVKKSVDPLKKRDARRSLEIIDDSLQRPIIFTLWGEIAEDFVTENHTIMAAHSAKVSKYWEYGSSLNANHNTELERDPNCPGAKQLKEWFKAKAGSSFPAALIIRTNPNPPRHSY